MKEGAYRVGHNAPGAESLGGAENSQQAYTFFNTVHSQNTLYFNMGGVNWSIPLRIIGPVIILVRW